LGTDAGPKLAIAYGRRGNVYHDKSEYDRAIADYTKAIEMNPRDAAAYNNRGIAYRAKGENESAIADYTKAIEMNPRDAVAHNNRGIAYRAQGDNDRPIADHARAIAIDPESASAYNNRGIAYRTKGDNDRAIADHAMAIEIDGESASTYYNRALAFRAKGDNDSAIEDTTMAIEINPRHVGAYVSRGLAHAAKGNHDRAIADYTKAIEINPKHAGAYHNRGLAYRAKGDDDRAVADHTRVVEINKKPSDVDAIPVSIASVPLSSALIEKNALPPSDAPSPSFSLVLRTDLSAQQLTVVEDDTVLYVWPISSGTQGYATPTGTFQPRSAHRMWYSRQYDWTPMPYTIFFVRGVAFHGTNITSRLGKSASHGCIRLATSNAAQLFSLVHKHGFAKTQITVFGSAKHHPAAVTHRTPTPRIESTAPSGLPSWANALFRPSP
jgi:tetratricopeptide (TPR) repeat protein